MDSLKTSGVMPWPHRASFFMNLEQAQKWLSFFWVITCIDRCVELVNTTDIALDICWHASTTIYTGNSNSKQGPK